MRIDCGPTKKPMTEREKRALEKWRADGDKWRLIHAHRLEWHPHFAWWPARLADHDCRWLEWIERRQEFYSGGTMWPFDLVRNTYYRLSAEVP